MPRYVAFLRGVSPQNAKMPELKRAFESAGFTEVRTLLSSGNVVFNARKASPASLEQRADKAMQATLGRSFGSFVRSAEQLQALITSDPFARFGVAPEAKRIITFLRSADVSTRRSHLASLQVLSQPSEPSDAAAIPRSGCWGGWAAARGCP